MKKMKRMKKILSLVLCFVMLVGILPVGALAADGDGTVAQSDTVSTIIAMSDYQNSSLSSGEKKTVPQTIVNKMVNAGVNPELAVLAGDYVDGSVYEDGSSTNASEMATEFANLTNILKLGWSGLADKDILAIQGNHDAAQFLEDGTLDATGAYEYDNYIIYLINEDSFPWWQGGYDSYSDTDECKKTVTATSNALSTYLNNLISSGDTRPVIIVTHVPIHWSQRSTNTTSWWVDNIYANILFDVVNKAAEKLDILFMFGHNHSSSSVSGGYDVEIGGALAYVAKGESMKIPNGKNGTANYTTETLNFTYMNAGYVGNYNGSTADCSISAITIDSDSIDIARYTYSGDSVVEKTITLTNTGSSESEGGTTTPTETTESEEGTAAPTETTESEEETTAPAETTEPEEESNGDWYEIPASVGGYEQVTDLSEITATDKYLVVLWRYFGNFTSGANNTYNGSNGVIVGSSGNGGKATIAGEPGDEYAKVTSDNIDDTDLWYITYDANDGTVALKNVSTGKYLSDSSVSADTSSAVNFTIAEGKRNGYSNFAIQNSNTYCLRTKTKGVIEWSSGYKVAANQVSNANACNITLYKVVSASDGGYARLYGGLEQNYTTADSVKMETVLGKVKVQISSDADNVSSTIEVTEDMVTWDEDFNGGEAGTYTGTVTYKDQTLGTITVEITEKTVDSIELVTNAGTVTRGSGSSTATGGTIKVIYSDKSCEILDITLSMLKGDFDTTTEGTYTDLTVNYGDKTVGGFTLTVTPKSGNNYPEYPNEGAVKVNKTGTGINFQNTGVAKIELSASGVPMNQGVDIVIIVDTSSSMDDSVTFNGETVQRNQVLNGALADMIEELMAPREDGEIGDIDVAIAEFNGYTVNHYGNSLTSADNYVRITQDGSDAGFYGDGTADDKGEVMTGNRTTTAAGFTNISEFTVDTDEDTIGTGEDTDNVSSAVLSISSGTNYDKGLLDAYELLAAKKAAWEEDEVREQYVIFMTDGVPYQYNGVVSYYKATEWSDWLAGNYESEDEIPTTIANKNLYYWNFDNLGNGQPHFTAEAIKGTDAQKVVRVGSDGVAYLADAEGLGATLYTIGFCTDVGTDPVFLANKENTTNILKKIASDDDKALIVNNDEADNLSDAFVTIADSIKQAAYNARFVDTMGEDYNIQLASTVTRASDGAIITLAERPSIEVRSYSIWTRAEYEDGLCDIDDIGERKIGSDGNYVYEILETVTFNDGGTEAYIDGDKNKNILVDGVIYANNFWYNTQTNTDVEIDTDGDGEADYSLAPETFYWNLGTIYTTELALCYYVHLDGSMTGKAAGSYPTNESAVLYYDNYLGNACQKNTVSPVLAWESANVSYAFYLVNSKGKPVNMDGTEVTFANRVTIVNPTWYGEVLLNTEEGEEIDPLTIVADSEVLPENYTLYDYDAAYQVVINSDSTGKWTITKGSDVNTTYVTDFSNTIQYDNTLVVENDTYDYTHTTVWFAVVWEPQALPDTVVIDYGIPVDIHVMTNDMFGSFGSLVGVVNNNVIEDTSKGANSISSISAEGAYGSAEVIVPDVGATEANSIIRYTPSNMVMDSYDVFTYSVHYQNTVLPDNNGYYYNTVTVIPATTIYYEDDFVDLTVWRNSDDTKLNEAWGDIGETSSSATQDEDRPDDVKYAFSTVIDANNVYGYDSAYAECSQFSLNSARKVTVTSDKYAEAQFTFCGTGFDVISLTSNTTGTISVDVYAADDFASKAYDATPQKTEMVDTYYGYKQDDDGNWVVDKDSKDTLYQVPVMKVSDLDYGRYTVVITIAYYSGFDHRDYGSLDFYLDAIRVYDPAGTEYGENDSADGIDGNLIDSTIQNAYVADNEGWPQYIELRNQIIDAANYKVTENPDGTVSITGNELEGAIFIDGDPETKSIADYVNYGPNNELYLKPGQSVAFNLDQTYASIIADVQIGIKVASGDSVSYKIYDSTKTTAENASTKELNTATDMYYSIKTLASGTIVINNSGSSGIMSITNIKATYTQNPYGNSASSDEEIEDDDYDYDYGIMTTSLFMDEDSATTAVMSLRSVVSDDTDEKETEIVVFEPETFEVSINKTSVKVGQKVKVTVTTSEDVAYITVNGENVGNYRTNKKTGLRTWTMQLNAAEAGEMAVEVVAFNDENVASESIVKQVTVNTKNSGKKK